jgi:ferredoxin, 2Fe-2S
MAKLERQDMRVKFISRDGAEYEVETSPGESVMRCATAHAIPGIIGECGGALACATCHGYVDVEWLDRFDAPSPLEQELVEGCIDPRPESRLTCQLLLTEELNGIIIRVPPSQT